MPVYTITHATQFTQGTKAKLAADISHAHSTICGADLKYVNIRFVKIDPDDGYTAGKSNPNFFNLEGRIRDGRSKEVEEKLLWTLDQHVKDLLGDDAYFIALTTFNRSHLIENGIQLPLAK